MTYEELLNFIAKERMINSQYGIVEDDKAYGEVMEALEKVEQLENENKELKEKQIPAKPIIGFFEEEEGAFDCPSCGTTIVALNDRIEHNYCLNCGQAIDWSDVCD